MSAARTTPPDRLPGCERSFDVHRRRWLAICAVFGGEREQAERPACCPFCQRAYAPNREAQLTNLRG